MKIDPRPFYGLSFAAGCVDAISFIACGGVFTANMTGNTVLFGIALGAKFGFVNAGIGLVPPLLSIVAFIVGTIATLPFFRANFEGIRAARVIVAEAVLVAIASFVFNLHALQAPYNVSICIVLVSFVMGMQSIVAAKAGLPGISTTYVTGSLVTAVVSAFGSGGDRRRKREAGHDTLAWVGYLAGAVLGTLCVIGLRRFALWPTTLLFIGLAIWIYHAFAHIDFKEA
jgi:uncharacterized membrane protein YoaK (UPF0700 family)